MRFLIRPDPKGAWLKAGQPVRVITLSEQAKVEGATPLEAASLAALCTAEGLTAVPPTPAQIAAQKAAALAHLLAGLKQLLAGFHSDQANSEAFRLASAVQYANENGHPEKIPAILRGFDPGTDAELVAAKTAALALLPP